MENVLVPCAYSPTYVVKDFPIARYQGLQFVSVTGTGSCSHGRCGQAKGFAPSPGQGCYHLGKPKRKCPWLRDQAELPSS